MRKQLCKVGVAFACAAAMLMGALAAPQTVSAVGTGAVGSGYTEVYRLYNKYTGEHFYTPKVEERNSLSEVGWKYEGISFYVWGGGYDPDNIDWIGEPPINPVYRLYNPYVPGGDHHYTMDENEYKQLAKVGWRQEKVAWQACTKTDFTVPVYRLYNPYAKTGTHHYTIDDNERQVLVKAGWRYEGIAMYSFADPSAPLGNVKTSDFKGDVDYETSYFTVELPPAKVDSTGLGNGWNKGEWGVDQLSDTSWHFYVKPVGDWDTSNEETTIYVTNTAPKDGKYIGTTSGGKKVWGVDKVESYGSGASASSRSRGFFKYDGDSWTYHLPHITLK